MASNNETGSIKNWSKMWMICNNSKLALSVMSQSNEVCRI